MLQRPLRSDFPSLRALAASVLLATVVMAGSTSFVAASVASTAGPPGNTVAFVNVNVVSMDPGDPTVQRRMTVIVQNGIITAIGKAKKVDVPDNAEVVDGRRKFLLPGLNDMHFHFRVIRQLPENFKPVDVYTILLAHGVTGIFDVWGFPEAFKWQRDVDRGKVLGPRFRFTSPAIDEDQYPSIDAIEADVRAFAKKGYQWIKSHVIRSEAAFDRIFATAADVGLPVVGHALRPGFPSSATLARGPLMLAHVEEILSTTPHTPDNFQQVFQAPAAAVADAGTWVTSTLVVYEVIAATVDDNLFAQLPTSPGMEYLPPTAALVWTTQNPYRDPGFLQDRAHWLYELRVQQYIAKRLRAEKAVDRLLLGTDAGGVPFVVPGVSVHDELRLLDKSGLTAMEAIQTATRNPAAFFGESDVAGTVSVGKRADLILVRKNPTRKVANLANLAGTMVRGTWLSEDVLRERLDELKQRWEQ